MQEGPDVDPFDLYHIDSDVPPDKANSRDRKPPADAWDAFNLSRIDKTTLRDDNFPSITGRWASNVPPLPSRLRQMGKWIRDVAGQPAAVWWAVRQLPIHPDIRREIRLALTDSQRPISPAVREAWYYLLEYWEQGRGRNADLDAWRELKKRISKDGWSKSVVRAYAACFRPYLRVAPWGNPKPPEQEDEIHRSELVHLGVAYPDHIEKINIPDEWVAPVVVVLRKNLETALELETETDRGGLGHISPIIPDQSSDSDHKRRLSGAVIEFISVFEHLIQIDLKAARREFSKWPIEDDVIFTRLRIWAAGKSDLVSDDQFGPMLTRLSDEAFWDRSHEWDLLHTLLVRWDGLSADTCVEIEKRILKEPARRKDEDEEKSKEWRALSILARITWLSQKGCKLRLNLEEETDRLRRFVPDWKPEHTDEVVRYWGTKIESVNTETDYSAPDRPVRAFSALRVAAEKGDFPDWWSTFLNAEKRKTDKPRFVALIAERLARYLDKGNTELIRPAASWLLNVSDHLAHQYPTSFHRVTSALIRILAKEPESSDSGVWQIDGVRDWMTTALNAPAGKVAQSVLCRAQQTDFLEYADELLALPGDLSRQAVAIFAQRMSWFYVNNREWSEANLLSALDSSDLDDKEAFWGGFFCYKTVNQELFMRLKPHLFQLAREDGKTRREHSQGLSSIILSGWGSVIEGTSDRCISNEEFRTVLVQADDEFRSHVLHKMRQLWNNEEEETRGKWTSLLPEFLRDVWPRQRKANSPAVSSSLCYLVLYSEKLFPELVQIVLPLLTKIDFHLHYAPLHKLSEDAFKKHSRQKLDLLYAVLSDNVSSWPYDIEDILASIVKAEPTLRTNEKFLELKRRWDSR